jgi:hypothetical protein
MPIRRTKSHAVAAVLALALLLFSLPSIASAVKHHRGAVPAAKQRPLYWGAWIGDQLTGEQPPWDMSAVSSFEGLVGKGLSLVEFAAPFANCGTSPCSYYDFPSAQMEAIRAYGAIPFFGWSTAGSAPGLEDPPFQLVKIIAGSQDSYIREFAEAARNWGHPFFLRFNWEMNGNWFPWSEGVNGNQAGEYVAAWRHVHDIFTAVGATNASWVWCPYADPNASGKKLAQLQSFYPGDEYVDWTCMDGFNWAKNPTNPHPWRSFDQIVGPTYRQITERIAPSKPMILAEVASTGAGKAKAAWIRGMFKSLATKYGRVRALIWFDQVDREVSWPLETSPKVTRAFSRGVHQRGFKTNGQASISASPIPPPH